MSVPSAFTGTEPDQATKMSGNGGGGEETKSVFLKFKEIGSAHYGRSVEATFDFDGSFAPGTFLQCLVCIRDATSSTTGTDRNTHKTGFESLWGWF